MLGMIPLIAFVLIALGVGFIICVKAKKETGMLKPIGYCIGILIIVVSFISLISVAVAMLDMKRQSSMMGQQRGMMNRAERRPMPRAAQQMPPAPKQTEVAPSTK